MRHVRMRTMAATGSEICSGILATNLQGDPIYTFLAPLSLALPLREQFLNTGQNRGFLTAVTGLFCKHADEGKGWEWGHGGFLGMSRRPKGTMKNGHERLGFTDFLFGEVASLGEEETLGMPLTRPYYAQLTTSFLFHTAVKYVLSNHMQISAQSPRVSTSWWRKTAVASSKDSSRKPREKTRTLTSTSNRCSPWHTSMTRTRCTATISDSFWTLCTSTRSTSST